MIWEWAIRIAALIAILGFLGLATFHDVADHYLWAECFFGILIIFLLYARANQVLAFARWCADSYFRLRMNIKITEPNPQNPVKDAKIRIQGTYRVKPDPEEIRVFHRANGDYFLQDKIQFWEKGHGKKQWYADVHVIRVDGYTHDIVIARCSDDNLVTLRYFGYVKDRTGHHYPIPYLGKGPGFCILQEIHVPFPKA